MKNANEIETQKTQTHTNKQKQKHKVHAQKRNKFTYKVAITHHQSTNKCVKYTHINVYICIT